MFYCSTIDGAQYKLIHEYWLKMVVEPDGAVAGGFYFFISNNNLKRRSSHGFF